MLKGTQAKIYDFLVDHTKHRGYSPSLREIGLAVGLFSSSTVHGHLDRLEKKGLIRRDPRKPRAIELNQISIQGNQNHISLPVIGKVTAGIPIEANENIEMFIPVLADMEGSFFLTVEGDSMKDAGILNGDYILVKNQSIADNGDIVVAKTSDGNVTVKKFYKEKYRVRLQPCNKEYEAMYFSTISLVGVVVGMYRFNI
ncbi:transcriptional repressor LexA [Paenibacillus periandrae]|uniref:transcriptional repressor LexA n=1 Tax=Paenibacillus periandrae TaxID=1761741 RepID=UPI001F092DF3|nr:transcriptional repressor LexA [Paenibacillus periandrae]